MNPIFDILTFDTNALNYAIKIYLSNSATTITGGVGPYTIVAKSFNYNTWNLYNELRENYNVSYRYVHLLIQVNVSVSQLTKYYLRNVSFKIGSTILPEVSHKLYNASSDSTSAIVTNLDETFVNYKKYSEIGNLPSLTTTEKSSIVGAINEIDANIDNLSNNGVGFSQIAQDLNNVQSSAIRVNNKSASSGIDNYYLYSFDAQGLGVAQMNPIFDILTFDTNALNYLTKIYLSNSPTTITGGVSYTSPTKTFVYGKFNNYNELRENYNTSYRYVHLLIEVNVSISQLIKYYLRNVSLKIGSTTLPLVGHKLYNGSTDATAIMIDMLDETLLNFDNYRMLENPLYAKTVATFGDSITWYDGQPFGAGHSEVGQIAKGYQTYMRNALKCIIKNEGLSSRALPDMWTEKISTYNFVGVDAVTITSGANDHRKGIAVGAIQPIGGTFNTATFTVLYKPQLKEF
jgi:hypothetical protein